jgi:Kef-type K+ transport system membrane component KefB
MTRRGWKLAATHIIALLAVCACIAGVVAEAISVPGWSRLAAGVAAVVGLLIGFAVKRFDAPDTDSRRRAASVGIIAAVVLSSVLGSVPDEVAVIPVAFATGAAVTLVAAAQMRLRNRMRPLRDA